MPPTPYSELLARVTDDNGAVALDIPDDWLQGRSVFGGLQAALALRAMRGVIPTRPLRTLQATFFAPVPQGTMRARAQIVRTGKAASHAEARIFDNGTTLALVTGVFGDARPSQVRVTPEQAAVAEPLNLEMPFVPGLFPNFTQHFAVRFLRGSPPFTGAATPGQILNVTLRDTGPTTEAHIVAFADLIPPLALSYLHAPAPGSTVTWMLQILTPEVSHLALADWRLDGTLAAAHGGYTAQSVMIWGPGGVPVAIGHQNMMIFDG